MANWQSVMCSAVLACSSLGSSAALVDYGTYTRDTATNLEWLDVTASAGFSLAAVSSQFGSGATFEGYRYATGDEVTALLSHGGVGIEPGQDYTATSVLINLFGITFESHTPGGFDVFATDGMFAVADPDMYGSVRMQLSSALGFFQFADTFFDPSKGPSSDASPGMGSWLVREAAVSVPEPGSLSIVALGLVGVIAMRRRR